MLLTAALGGLAQPPMLQMLGVSSSQLTSFFPANDVHVEGPRGEEEGVSACFRTGL